MKCSLDKLPSIMGLDYVEKGFFAWRLANRIPTLDYRGELPSPYEFGIDQMSDEKRKLFWEYYTPLTNDPNFVYDLKEEALKYCRYRHHSQPMYQNQLFQNGCKDTGSSLETV